MVICCLLYNMALTRQKKIGLPRSICGWNRRNWPAILYNIGGRSYCDESSVVYYIGLFISSISRWRLWYRMNKRFEFWCICWNDHTSGSQRKTTHLSIYDVTSNQPLIATSYIFSLIWRVHVLYTAHHSYIFKNNIMWFSLYCGSERTF